MSGVNIHNIRPGYLAGIPPKAELEKLMCDISKTFHWLCFVEPDADDYIITESVAKGTALNKFAGKYTEAHIYRVKDIGILDPFPIYDTLADWGDSPYGNEENVRTAIWWILKHWFNRVIPIEIDRSINCVTWVNIIWTNLGMPLVPFDCYPTPALLEQSPILEFVGIWSRQNE